MNRVQRAFIGVFVAILALDLVASLVLAVTQGSGLVANARLVTGATAIILLAGGLLLAGSIRTFPSRGGMQNSPVLATPSFGRMLRDDRSSQASGVSDFPVVGILYGLFMIVVTFFLYLVPG